jgi:hypothetical protein
LTQPQAAACKSAISSSLLVEYALHVRELTDLPCGDANG